MVSTRQQFEKISYKEKELKKKKEIEKAKHELAKLQNKWKIQVGTLAFKHKLHEYSLTTLDKAFKNLAKDLAHGSKDTD